MAGTLNITTAGQYTVGTQSITVGSTTTPVQLSYASDLVCTRSIILNNTTGVLLTIGSGGDIASMDACIITSDKEIGISLEGNAAANNSTFILGAGQCVVISDPQIYPYAAGGNFAGGAPVDIETIRAKNGVATDATIRVWAFT